MYRTGQIQVCLCRRKHWEMVRLVSQISAEAAHAVSSELRLILPGFQLLSACIYIIRILALSGSATSLYKVTRCCLSNKAAQLLRASMLLLVYQPMPNQPMPCPSRLQSRWVRTAEPCGCVPVPTRIKNNSAFFILFALFLCATND